LLEPAIGLPDPLGWISLRLKFRSKQADVEMNQIRTKLAELLLCSSDQASLDSFIGEAVMEDSLTGICGSPVSANLCPKSCAKQAATLRGGKHSPERIAKRAVCRRPLNRHRGDLNRRSSRLKRMFFEVPLRQLAIGSLRPDREVATAVSSDLNCVSRPPSRSLG
jgi:hypothetical protein